MTPYIIVQWCAFKFFTVVSIWRFQATSKCKIFKIFRFRLGLNVRRITNNCECK